MQLIHEAEHNLVEGDELGQAYVQLWLGRNIHFDLGRDDLAVPALQMSLAFMRDYDHYEEVIRALTALGASHLRQNDLAGARAYLEEAYDLTHSQHFPWQRAEICYRLGCLALIEGQANQASDWAGRAQGAVAGGSAPDWQGPVHLLSARLAERTGEPAGEVVSMCQQAISLAQARCRGVERAWVLREAGNYLAQRGEGLAQGQGRALIAELHTSVQESC